MTIARIALALVATAFAALIVWAAMTADFWASFDAITADPWGLVTLADLYLGFLLSAIVIGFFERGWRAVLWILPLPFLGNVWTAFWFVMRLPALARALKGVR